MERDGGEGREEETERERLRGYTKKRYPAHFTCVLAVPWHPKAMGAQAIMPNCTWEALYRVACSLIQTASR